MLVHYLGVLLLQKRLFFSPPFLLDYETLG